MHQISSSFTRWKLTPEEQLSGSQLSSLQVAVIQNQICDLAEERISLQFDQANPSAFMQRDAELQGQIGILKYLLALNEDVRVQPDVMIDSQE